MKAAEDIIIIRTKEGTIVPYKEGESKEGLTFTVLKKDKEIPKEYLRRIIERNIEKISDVEYVDKFPVNLPKGFELVLPPEPKTMKIKKREYSQDSLNQLSFSALKEIGKKFNVTDRSKGRLINEILREQEVKQRAGL